MQGNKQSVLAQRLRALRQARDWTLKQAAAATGVSASALSKIENGLLSPTYDNLIKIAAGLDLDVAEFHPVRRPHGHRPPQPGPTGKGASTKPRTTTTACYAPRCRTSA